MAGPAQTGLPRAVGLLLNLGHGVDHLFLLIFAAAVTPIAAEFGFARWEDLMPYGAGTFLLFGLAAFPAGRLGDLWGRRPMMIVFFVGLGASALLVSLAHGPWQLAASLTLMGVFAAIYHPVGIPMLVRHAQRPGITIGVNGVAGNLGVAGAALFTGWLMQAWGWRAAFAVPGALVIGCGVLFAWLAPRETEPPARRTARAPVHLPPAELARALAVMTASAATVTLLFNFTTNGNGRLLEERFAGIIDDPARLGTLLAVIYALASLSQLVVGRLIDRFAFRGLYFGVVLAQAPLLVLAAFARGWWLYAVLAAVMALIFGAVPFTDAVIARYVDDRLRSRVSGVRLTVSLGLSSAAVWLLGPVVKRAGFEGLLLGMALVSLATALGTLALPREPRAARHDRLATAS